MRSGTTFVGSVLSKASDLFYLHEPFNPTWGIKGVDRWFPYVRNKQSAYSDVVDRFLDFDFTYRTVYDEDHWIGLVKKHLGGKGFWRGEFYRHLGHHFAGMLIKDPLAALLSGHMHDEHDVRIITMVRHPMGFYYSNKRLGWDFDLNELRVQPELLDDHLEEEISLLDRNDLSYPQRLAVLWRCINRVLHNYAKENDGVDTWACKRHEDLCLDPVSEFKSVFEKLQLEFTPSIAKFIRKSTGARNKTSAKNKETHRLQRNARKLAYYWKEKVSIEERDAVRTITEPIASHYYDDDSWMLGYRSNTG
jgi:hypothetical protein